MARPCVELLRSCCIHRLVPSASLIAFLLSACGSDSPTSTQLTTPVVTTITLDKPSLAFDAVGATAALVATVKDQTGKSMSAVTVSWTSNDTAVATVGHDGAVTSSGNGRATITASADGKSASVEATVAQVITQVLKVHGDQQTDTVAQVLPESLVAVGRDRLGNPVIGMPLSFVSHGGSVSPDPAVTDRTGRAAVQWTLGPMAGIQTVDVGPQAILDAQYFAATALPEAADTLIMVWGDSQIGLPGMLLDPIAVAVTDRYGNTLPGHTVSFAVTSGGGVLDSTTRVTRAYGSEYLAATAWTLGPGVGEQTAEARIDGMKGSPVTFRATAMIPTMSRVEPDTLRERFGATVYGSGFGAADLQVVIDGYGALTAEYTDTSIHVEVPTYGCRPARDVKVWLTAPGISLPDTVQRHLQPTSMVYDWGTPRAAIDLQPGEGLLIRGVPGDLDGGQCLQFGESSVGDEEYLVGLGMTAESPTVTSAWTIASEVGAPAPSAPALRAAWPAATSQFMPTRPLPGTDRRQAYLRAEQRVRALERRIPAVRGARRAAAGTTADIRPLSGSSSGAADSTVVTIRVPNLAAADPCATYTEIGARPRWEGSAIIALVDTAYVPPSDSLANDDFLALNALLADTVLPIERAYLDSLTDFDANGHLLLVFSLEVNRLLNGAMSAFAFGGDLRDGAACAASDVAEVIYVQLPDPSNIAGTVPQTRASLLQDLPRVLTHELAHLAQDGYLAARQVQSPHVVWEAEGQAALMEEVVGHALLGHQPYQDYGAAVALDAASGGWYAGLFADVAAYFGWDGQGGKYAGTPEGCTLFGSPDLATSCDPRWFVGTAWSFMRYISDRFGPTWPGGEAAIHRQLLSSVLGGRDNISGTLPVGFTDLFADWAAALALDGNAGFSEPRFELTSWNLSDIMTALGAGAALEVPVQPFVPFSDQRQIRDGGTAYLRLSAPGSHPAMAVKITSPGGLDAATAREPVLWVVRTK